MKNKILFKIILLLVIIVLLGGIILFSEKIQKIPFIEKMKQAINEENNVTTVDVTGIELGKETQHEHIYKTMYDENKHWEECIICNEKRNENTHTLTTTWATGNESCHYNNSYTKTCGCGYSETGHKPCVWNGTAYYFVDDQHIHARKCSKCQEYIMYSYYLNSYGNGPIYSAKYETNANVRYSYMQDCYNTKGERLTCQNTGTCATCKYNYTAQYKKHRFVGDFPGKDNKVVCVICYEEFGTYDYKVTRDSNTPNQITVVLNFNLTNGVTYNSIQEYNTNIWRTCTQSVSNKNSENTQFTITREGTLKTIYKKGVLDTIGLRLKCNNLVSNFGIGLRTFYPDSISPTILNISLESGNEWSKNKPITISGTENWTETVDIKIENDKGKIIYNGGANVTNNNWSVLCTPELETGDDSRVFTVTVTDACENSVEQQFTISKIDSIAPEVTSVDKVDEEWSKEKSITFTASDHGIGNVQIAFNDVADYELASKNGTEYSREYKLTGDVYSPREANVYYKDELGNISSKKVIIDKIDNTKPTITGASFSNNKLNITANDRHQTEGEGSGVSKYRFITSTTKLENPEITLNNSTEVLANENMVIPEIYKVKYVYVVAEDAVGNISEVYEVKVPQLELTSKVNLSGANGKGIVELDWSSYDISSKYFVIYRKQENETEWETIVSLEENFNGNKYIDNLGNDNKNPSISNINIEGKQEANSIEITANSTDSGTKYIYYIESYDSNDMSLLSISNEK